MYEVSPMMELLALTVAAASELEATVVRITVEVEGKIREEAGSATSGREGTLAPRTPLQWAARRG